MDEILKKTASKPRVILSAPVLTESGYGVHSRQIATWLLEKHRRGEIELFVHAVPWGNTPWFLDGNMQGGLVGEIQQRTVVPSGMKFDVSIQLKLPNEWDPKMATTNVGVTAGVETDRCNPAWVEACNCMQHVVVPSQHVRRALEATGKIDVPLSVVPEAYPAQFARPSTDPNQVDEALAGLGTKFNFLVFGQVTGDSRTDRKNTFSTLRWLMETFAGDPDVGIVLKTNMGRNSKIDREVTTMTLRNWKAGFQTKQMPHIHLFHGSMTDVEVRSLYTHPTVKALVSLTRGEGWGLPLLEAAVCGLPVIATDWSGHLDFLNEGRFLKVNYDLREVPSARVDNSIFVRGARWAEPKEEDFKRKVAKFRVSGEVPRQWASELRATLIDKFSPAAVFSMYDRELGGYLRRG